MDGIQQFVEERPLGRNIVYHRYDKHAVKGQPITYGCRHYRYFVEDKRFENWPGSGQDTKSTFVVAAIIPCYY